MVIFIFTNKAYRFAHVVACHSRVISLVLDFLARGCQANKNEPCTVSVTCGGEQNQIKRNGERERKGCDGTTATAEKKTRRADRSAAAAAD
jgi:hypothetical protein